MTASKLPWIVRILVDVSKGREGEESGGAPKGIDVDSQGNWAYNVYGYPASYSLENDLCTLLLQYVYAGSQDTSSLVIAHRILEMEGQAESVQGKALKRN